MKKTMLAPLLNCMQRLRPLGVQVWRLAEAVIEAPGARSLALRAQVTVCGHDGHVYGLTRFVRGQNPRSQRSSHMSSWSGL